MFSVLGPVQPLVETPMSDTPLKLVTETDRVPDSFKLERRREPRHRIYARVTAVAHNPLNEEPLNAGAGQIRSLELQDQSAGGLGAWSTAPIAVGSRVTAFFPPHGNAPGYNAVGRVVRCVAQDQGHNIGLVLESQVAAA